MNNVKYLYTWYGTSDLMAALGGEMQPGPIMNALLHDDYQFVYILAYTNLEKENALHEARDFAHQLLERREQLSPLERTELCQRIGNTAIAHQLFVMWVKQQLKQKGKEAQVLHFPANLQHLNDTESIYTHVMNGFKLINTNKATKQVTLFLSPGTPVMAFIWAFSALRQAQLNLRLISSSNADLPPEEVCLPVECMRQFDCHINEPENKPAGKPDIVFHLFGEQRWPILQAMYQFLGAKHVFVYTEKYPPDDMRVFLGSDKELEKLEIFNPYDYTHALEEMRTYVRSHLNGDERVIINLTGGTKPMSFAAYQLCREMNYCPVYVNGDSAQLINLNDNTAVPIKPIPRVDFFLKQNFM